MRHAASNNRHGSSTATLDRGQGLCRQASGSVPLDCGAQAPAVELRQWDEEGDEVYSLHSVHGVMTGVGISVVFWMGFGTVLWLVLGYSG